MYFKAAVILCPSNHRNTVFVERLRNVVYRDYYCITTEVQLVERSTAYVDTQDKGDTYFYVQNQLRTSTQEGTVNKRLFSFSEWYRNDPLDGLLTRRQSREWQAWCSTPYGVRPVTPN